VNNPSGFQSRSDHTTDGGVATTAVSLLDVLLGALDLAIDPLSTNQLEKLPRHHRKRSDVIVVPVGALDTGAIFALEP